MIKKKDYIWLAIAVAIGVLIKLFFPAVGGLTEAGVNLLAIFIPTVLLWIFIGTGWPTFLSLVVVALTGVTDGQTVFNHTWGNSVNTIIIPMLIIVQVMQDSGAMNYIAEWIISRKIVHGRPYVFMILLCVAITLIGTVVYPVVMCYIFIQLAGSIAESIGYTKKDKFYKALILIILWVATVMDGMWPFAKAVPNAIMAFLASLGFDVNIVDWMKFSVPYGIVSIVVSLLVIRFLYRPDVSKFKNFDDAAIRAKLKANPINRSGKVATLGVVVVIFAWVFGLSGIIPYLQMIGAPTAACLVVAIMCLLKDESGKPIIEISSALAKVSWGVVVFIAGVMYFAIYIGKPDFGIVAGFTTLLSGLVANVSPLVLIAIATLIALIVTNFMSNTVSATISASVFVPILMATAGVNEATIIACGIAIGCLVGNAYLTYASSPTAGVTLTPDTVSLGEAAPYSLAMMAVTYVISIFVLVPLVIRIL